LETGENVMASYTVNSDLLADLKVILLWQMQILVEGTCLRRLPVAWGKANPPEIKFDSL